MSSGDDDYGNPQREIEHQRVLPAMRDERITSLTAQLQAVQEQAERYHKALAHIAANPRGANFLGVAEIAARAINDTKEPSPTTTEPRP